VSENLQKFIGIAVMAVIVVVGVAATNDDDSDFTRNAAFVKLGDIKGEVKGDGGEGKDNDVVKHLRSVIDKSFSDVASGTYVPDGRNDRKIIFREDNANRLAAGVRVNGRASTLVADSIVKTLAHVGVSGNSMRGAMLDLVAQCAVEKVGGVFLKSHLDSMAADCVAATCPPLSPKRASRLGVWTNGNATSVWTNGNATSVWTNGNATSVCPTLSPRD
jgi:transcription elongation factor